MTEPTLDWLVTALFGTATLYHLAQLLVGHSWADRIDHAIQAGTAGVLTAVPWPAYSSIPTQLQIGLAIVGTGWYGYLYLFRTPAQPANRSRQRHGWLSLRAATTVSEAWIAIATSPFVPAASDQSMVGMSSMDSASMQQAMSGVDMVNGSQPWAEPISLVGGVAFAATGLLLLIWFIAGAVRAPVRAGATSASTVLLLDRAASVVMATGLAVTLLFLIG